MKPILIVLALLSAAPAVLRAATPSDLKKLLLSSPWCSFSYNQYSGVTRQKRVEFGRDGTWSAGGRREVYSSGDNGSMAGQQDSQEGGRWAVKNGRLFMSEDGSELEAVDLQVRSNSNGYPILVADGAEYSQCR
jgi:hypothetical protein